MEMASQTASIVIRGADAVEMPFRIAHVSQPSPAGEVLITWLSSVGGIYQIETSPDLDSWVPVDGIEILASGEITMKPVTVPAGALRQFYRVKRLW